MSLFHVFLEFSKTNQEGEGTEQQQQTYQFAQGYNILYRLQVHYLTLTFIIHNKYLSTLLIFIYILVNFMIMLFFYDRINIIRYKLLGTYKEE